MTFRSPSLSDIVATLEVDRVDELRFVATQLDNPAHHIVGGHIAGQALMAASRTAPGRVPHSVHVYYVRAGDARHPVDIDVDVARDGGTLSTRQITARQNGQILLEALASFSTPVESLDYQHPIPDVPEPDSLLPVQEQLAAYRDEFGGHWVRPQPFDLRYVDAPPRLREQTAELVFEAVGAPALCVARSPELVAISAARTTALILELGADTTNAVAVLEGTASLRSVACARTWFGSARCLSTWTIFIPRLIVVICSFP